MVCNISIFHGLFHFKKIHHHELHPFIRSWRKKKKKKHEYSQNFRRHLKMNDTGEVKSREENVFSFSNKWALVGLMSYSPVPWRTLLAASDNQWEHRIVPHWAPWTSCWPHPHPPPDWDLKHKNSNYAVFQTHETMEDGNGPNKEKNNEIHKWLMKLTELNFHYANEGGVIHS